MGLCNGKTTLGMYQFSKHSCTFRYVITMTYNIYIHVYTYRYIYLTCLDFRVC